MESAFTVTRKENITLGACRLASAAKNDNVDKQNIILTSLLVFSTKITSLNFLKRQDDKALRVKTEWNLNCFLLSALRSKDIFVH